MKNTDKPNVAPRAIRRSRRLLFLAIPLCLLLLSALYLSVSRITLVHKPQAVASASVFDGSTGRALDVTDRESVERIVALSRAWRPKRSGVSLGYTGYRFRITLKPTGESFILNAPDTVRKDPFFYTVSDNGLYAFLDALMDPQAPQTEIEPSPVYSAPESASSEEIDALALLRSFSDARVVTLYDCTQRDYSARHVPSFDELLAAGEWTARRTDAGFPASAPDRLIELLAGERVLRIEDNGDGDLLYMISAADWDGSGPVTYLDGGDSLMDDWMTWARAKSGM